MGTCGARRWAVALCEDRADQSPVTEGRLLQGEPTRDQQQRLHQGPGLAEKENTGARRPVAVQTVTGRQAWS